MGSLFIVQTPTQEEKQTYFRETLCKGNMNITLRAKIKNYNFNFCKFLIKIYMSHIIRNANSLYILSVPKTKITKYLLYSEVFNASERERKFHLM